jgi:hypothetical protein
MDGRDLSDLDRNTLRLWRATNLIGWGLAGIGAYVVTWVLLEAVSRGLDSLHLGFTVFLAFPMIAVTLLVPPLVAGIVIGDHVYRWPGWTTLAAWLVPTAVLAVRADINLALQELAIFGFFGLVIALITARVARVRFEMRPRALRSAA